MLKKLWQARATTFCSEPRQLEEKAGIQGVSHTYRMPGDMAPLQLALYVPTLSDAENSMPVRMVFKLHMTRLGVGALTETDPAMLRYALAKEIMTLNPELQTRDIDLTRHSGAVCLGALSGYKPEDIEYFIKERSRGIAAIAAGEPYQEPPHITALAQRCQQLFGDQYGDDMKWTPSPETAAHIHRELDRVYGVAPPKAASVPVTPPVTM